MLARPSVDLPFMLAPEKRKGAKVTLPENAIQRAVFSHIRSRGVPGLVAFHPKNGGVHQIGRRSGINVGMGVLPGVPDVIAIHQGRTYALELKTEKGDVEPEQMRVLGLLMAAGATVAISRGLDEALEVLEGWRLLRGERA